MASSPGRLCRACLAGLRSHTGQTPFRITSRSLHTSSRRFAQPAPGYDRYDSAPPPPSTASSSSQQNRLATRPNPQLDDPFAPSSSRASPEVPVTFDYEPTPDDFCTVSSSSSDLPDPGEYVDDLNEASLPDIPPLFDRDPTVPTKLKRARIKSKRRGTISDLPPLPAGHMPADGLSRFDWRTRPLKRAAVGDKWFPDLERTRQEFAAEKLGPGDMHFEELQRYRRHFEPMLRAEFAEEERAFRARLEEWGIHRLKREGYTLDELYGTSGKSRKEKGRIVTFSLGGKGNQLLPFHRFQPGACVLISRTDPARDPVLDDGRTRAEAGQGRNWMQGTVLFSGKGSVKVSFESPVHGIEKGQWRIDVGLSDWVLKQQLSAISAFNNDPFIQDMGDQMAHAKSASLLPRAPFDPVYLDRWQTMERSLKEIESEFTFTPPPDQSILQGTALRDKFLRAFQEDYIPYDSSSSANNAELPIINSQDLKPDDIDAVPVPSRHLDEGPGGILARNQLIQSWTKRWRSDDGREPIPVEGDPVLGMNPSQMRAIAMMLSERLSLVQGPPGTGKTRVIIETIKLLKQRWQIPFPILVCAHTNVAVDNLLAGLRQHGVRAIRSGPVERVRPSLQGHTLEASLEEHPMNREVNRIEEVRDQISQQIDALVDQGGQGRIHDLVARKKEIIKQLKRKRDIMNREVLLDADVICTTCLSAASRTLRHIDFPMVFLDEASMATEPLSILPLMKGSSHVAIIGDHKQLPPVIISPEANAGGLSTSLFERLIHERHVPSIMLDTQYRMHPAISAFPSAAFYNSDLKDGTVVNGQIQDGFQPPITAFLVSDGSGRRNVTFIDHDHPESPNMKSICNHGDAEMVCNVVADLLAHNPELNGSDIGIISPYAAQIRLISHQLTSDPIRSDAFRDVLGDERAMELGDIEIKTVDGFEGREKEVVIFSTVRCNSLGYIGFLGDWRRFNVGLTRARRALIMIGSATTLEKAKMVEALADHLPSGGTQLWKDFIRYLREEGLVLRAE